MAEKVTTMVLKVDLHCSRCYKKIKKVLCKFLQIRNQVYDEKANTVTITVVCCNPEKIRDKLCCKGGKTIKSIEIKPPPKPKEPEKPKKPEQKKDEPIRPFDWETSKGTDKAKEPEKPKALAEKLAPEPVSVFPVGVCCGQCYEGNYGGPCYQGYGRSVPSYDGYGYGYGGNKVCYVSPSNYFNEENTSGCTIM